LLLVPLLAISTAALADVPMQPYVNPVIGDARRVQQPLADPFVLKWRGDYYLYATGEPIVAYRSADLVRWQSLGGVLAPSKDPKAWNQAELRAPAVVYRQGKFYLYYTATRKSKDWRVTEAERRVGVAVADSPAGPFVDSGKPVTKGWAVDGTVFKDPDGGKEYLFYSYLFEPRLPGAGVVVDRRLDWSAAAGRPALVTRGSAAWEDQDGDPQNGSLRYTNEAPVVVKRLGRYITMYGGGSWDLPTYAVGWASSDRVVRGGLDGPAWQKGEVPLLRGSRFVEGPGRTSVVKAPNNLDDICVHHARVVPFADPSHRLPFVARLTWNHDRPFMAPPSIGEQAAPDRPLFEDSFARAAGPLGSGCPRTASSPAPVGRACWKIEGGTWWTGDGQVKQNKDEGTARATPIVPALESYIFESNLRFATPGVESGAIGVVAFEAGADNRVEVWIDAKKQALVSGGKLAGKPLPEVATRLGKDFVGEAYHELLVTKNGGRLRIALDGVSLQARRMAMGAGTVALQTREAKAIFDAVAVTSGFEDDFLPGREACTSLECAGWVAGAGSWRLGGGRLQQTDGKAERALAVKGELGRDYEITATLRWGKATASTARGGVAAAVTDKGELVLASLERNIWPLARLHLEHVAGGKVKNRARAVLPRGFDYAAPHTLRVVRQGEAFTVFVDGAETGSIRAPVGLARAGLYTSGTDAAFLSVTWKQLVVPQNYVLDPSFESAQWLGARVFKDGPWQVEGTARRSECCGHSGQHRLLFQGGWGRARQKVSGLPPGRYTLRAWVTAAGGAEVEASAQVPGSAPVRDRARAATWTRLSLPLQVPRDGEVEIVLSGLVQKGAAASAAVDDVYLFRN
jgi:GH43 family beta-xylosidase